MAAGAAHARCMRPVPAALLRYHGGGEPTDAGDVPAGTNAHHVALHRPLPGVLDLLLARLGLLFVHLPHRILCWWRARRERHLADRDPLDPMAALDAHGGHAGGLPFRGALLAVAGLCHQPKQVPALLGRDHHHGGARAGHLCKAQEEDGGLHGKGKKGGGASVPLKAEERAGGREEDGRRCQGDGHRQGRRPQRGRHGQGRRRGRHAAARRRWHGAGRRCGRHGHDPGRERPRRSAARAAWCGRRVAGARRGVRAAADCGAKR
mmetsp:Transcript_43027/g.129219  ORF Transcript_43027/g.129219 Transcript_43027/m.129219 type:complete len:264 (-) Transcript_43027:92-883(-)